MDYRYVYILTSYRPHQIIMAPLQTKVMRMLSKLRRKAVLITDSRVKLTQEMLNGIKVIKFYGWEDSFSNQLHNLRSKELTYIRSLMVLRSVIMGVAVSENCQPTVPG
jgi:aminopeptidase C